MAEIAQAKYELSRGVILTITPLTAFMQRALNARAAEMHPEPDRAPYELEVEDALVPGTKTSAEHSQEFERAIVFRTARTCTVCLIKCKDVIEGIHEHCP